MSSPGGMRVGGIAASGLFISAGLGGLLYGDSRCSSAHEQPEVSSHALDSLPENHLRAGLPVGRAFRAAAFRRNR